MSCIVVGSGPAGVACAQALLARGAEVCLVDAGLTLEPERRALVERMRASTPETWDAASIARVKEGMDPTADGVVLKRVFGSDFPYRDAEKHIPADYAGVAARPSLALGGFSNVWGAAMLPYAAADLADWPITAADLAPYYAAVARFTGLAAQHDDLAELFPLHTDAPLALEASRQSQQLLARLAKHRAALRGAGLHFGGSRLALGAGCVRCGMCMYGCPYGVIYNSADTLRAMQTHPRFRYEPGVIVEQVRESGATATLSGYRRESREGWSAEASRVFLAAGVLPTTKIVLASRGLFDTPVWIKDSQYFLFPLLTARRTAGVADEALHTLSQVFLEVLDARLSRHPVHLQIYSYNDLIAGGIRAALGPLARGWPLRQLVERTMVAQGYLHSDESSRMRLTLEKSAAAPRLKISAELNPETPRTVRRVLRKLVRHAAQFGALPLSMKLKIAEPGRGFHCGGTLPMRAQPGALESDTLGRPCGYERVHVVDASVLPDIPATTITFSVMANAHRIGATADLS